jgi:hypothetical protein
MFHEDAARRRTLGRAEGRLGERAPYDLIRDNCEHFTTECRTGQPRSVQVEVGKQVAAAGLGVGAGAVTRALVCRLAARGALCALGGPVGLFASLALGGLLGWGVERLVNLATTPAASPQPE